MKKLIFHLILPISLISFGIITKWWYGIVIDTKDVFFYGFPMIYKCEGFHTSMSTQYFLTEMAVNFLTYFIFWIIVISIINLFWKIKIPKSIYKTFWIAYCILLLGFILMSRDFDDRYFLKRNFNIKIYDSGITLFENHSKERNNYQEKIKNSK